MRREAGGPGRAPPGRRVVRRRARDGSRRCSGSTLGGRTRRDGETAAVVERRAASDEAVYGISTGFGSLAQTRIPADRRTELQRSLIRSRAAGMGSRIERDAVRAMFFLRARSLAMGPSGARPLLVDTMLAMLEAGLDPAVPEHGSLGASGDLAPLAHCALAMLCEDAPSFAHLIYRPGVPLTAAVLRGGELAYQAVREQRR